MKTHPFFTESAIPKLVSIAGFIMGLLSIWVRMEISIAEINVELANLKQDMLFHKTENRKDAEMLRSENATNTREILRKVDEMQIYLRNRK